MLIFYNYTFVIFKLVCSRRLNSFNCTLSLKSCIHAIHNWYFVTKIVLAYCEKKMFLWLINKIEIRGWRPRICKNFEITSKIYSNSGSSEQLVNDELRKNLAIINQNLIGLISLTKSPNFEVLWILNSFQNMIKP